MKEKRVDVVLAFADLVKLVTIASLNGQSENK
jgi:hypothetical protein